MPKPMGLYRTRADVIGEESVYVDYHLKALPGVIPRRLYEDGGYSPPFETLPIQESLEVEHRYDIKRGSVAEQPAEAAVSFLGSKD